MPLVRCPTHKIPYNSENPRGCPACAREKEGDARASLMQELARVSKTTQQPPEPSTPQAARGESADEPSVSFLTALWDTVRRRRAVTYGGVLIVVLVIILVAMSGPTFVQAPHPVPYEGTVRPLPVEPNADIETVFGILGAQAPGVHPTSPDLARYSYGADLTIDALNGRVYAVTLQLPNRSWKGLRPGMSQQRAEGTLALLGTPERLDRGPTPAPEEMGNYLVYPSLDARPRRRLRTAVRPPNGCYDVLVELRPGALGLLRTTDQRYAVVGQSGGSLRWVVTQVQIVSRAMRGPLAGQPEC